MSFCGRDTGFTQGDKKIKLCGRDLPTILYLQRHTIAKKMNQKTFFRAGEIAYW
jgi:hypothetical protein